MVRTAEADESLLNYLEKIARNHNDGFTVGVIMGQPSQTRDYVVLLAKTPEREDDATSAQDLVSGGKKVSPRPQAKSLKDISDNWVANHALHVTRMLPGGMYVLGIFIVSPGDVFEDANSLTKIKSILNNTHKVMANNKYLYGAPGAPNTEKLVLHYCTKAQRYTCKGLDLKQITKSGMLHPVEWKFLPQSQSPAWQQLDCYYELDDIFPLTITNNEVSIKSQYQSVLSHVSSVVWSALMFIDGEAKDGADTLDSLLKKKKGSSKQNSGKDSKTLTVSLFIPSDFSESNEVDTETLRFSGSVSLSGVVCSSVWLHPRSTLTEAHQAIKCDVMRSLQARVQICCDSLEEDTVTDKFVISEPPRRVLIPLPSKVCLSDYIFNGEGASEAVVSALELLDYAITEDKVICDIENPADTTDVQGVTSQLSEDSLQGGKDERTVMIIVGIFVAVLVLILSMFFNFYSNFHTDKKGEL